MKWLRYMVLIAAWLMASWPCAHAMEEHAHEEASGVELCASASHECHCHDCDEVLCHDETAEAVMRLATGDGAMVQPLCRPLFTLTETDATCYPLPIGSSAPLMMLRTVHLLI